MLALLLAQIPVLAKVNHAPVDEMSGLVASQRYPGVFWTHNDSGDRSRLFPIRLDGKVMKPAYETKFWVDQAEDGKKEWPGVEVDGASNHDWEDIARDGDTLYIAETGNNGNARRDLGVYVVPEPNPEATGRVKTLKFLPIAYPDQREFPPKDEWRFDCEAMFVFRGQLHFLTKHRRGTSIAIPANATNLYRLDSARTDRVNVLRKLDGLPDLGGWVTAADARGRRLAVLTQAPVASIWLFELPKSGPANLQGRKRQILLPGTKQCEAIAWADDRTLIVSNEQRELFRIDAGP